MIKRAAKKRRKTTTTPTTRHNYPDKTRRDETRRYQCEYVDDGGWVGTCELERMRIYLRRRSDGRCSARESIIWVTVIIVHTKTRDEPEQGENNGSQRTRTRTWPTTNIQSIAMSTSSLVPAPSLGAAEPSLDGPGTSSSRGPRYLEP